ncbi:hypothetical protein F5X98DRAFT_391165 [Xylaria grammica]|nr:hypothetical protein F5X98DRAFT_391165 [Xylaria grammica]
MADPTSRLRTQLLNIKDYSDFTLECDGRKFRVHKAVFCGQSPVMAAALKGDFMEAKTGVLSVSFDIESVRRLIEYMYTGDYQMRPDSALEIISSGVSDGALPIKRPSEAVGTAAEPDPGVGVPKPSEAGTSDRLICHGRMNSIADYYDVPALAALSCTKAKEILRREWSTEPFYQLARLSLASTSDKNFLRMLGEEAMGHIDGIDTKIFDEGGLAEGIAGYALPKCILMLEASRKELRAYRGY